MNKKVVVLSVVALACLALTFLTDWLFIIPAAAISFYNWKLLKE